MSPAYWCVLAAGLMPYAFTAVAKGVGERYDNRQPREWQSRLSGLAARAHAAHLNSFEAFPLFAAAVIIADLGQADAARVDALALAFVLLRLGYGISYMAGWARTRSLLWLLALLCCVGLFISAA